jgi:hypothetical protein
MRTLYLPIIEPGGHHDAALANKRGLYDALATYGAVHQLDYLAVDVSTLYDTVAGWVRDFQPDLLLMQLHGADRLTPQNLADLRTLKPDMKLVNWNGDVHLHGLTAPDMLELLQQVDLQLVVNAAALPIYAEHGIKADYWQIGYEEPNEPLPLVPAYDVLFLGANYSDKRKQLGDVLLAYGESRKVHVGLFGDGWDDRTSNVYNFAEGAALYRACKVAIADNQFPEAPGAFSNRLFQALAAGAFVLQQHVPEIDLRTWIIPGIHFVEWRTIGELPEYLDHYLSDSVAEYRARIAVAGKRTVHGYHSFDARVTQLVTDLLPELKEHAA